MKDASIFEYAELEFAGTKGIFINKDVVKLGTGIGYGRLSIEVSLGVGYRQDFGILKENVFRIADGFSGSHGLSGSREGTGFQGVIKLESHA